jgi:hypothetical protein
VSDANAALALSHTYKTVIAPVRNILKRRRSLNENSLRSRTDVRVGHAQPEVDRMHPSARLLSIPDGFEPQDTWACVSQADGNRVVLCLNR